MFIQQRCSARASRDKASVSKRDVTSISASSPLLPRAREMTDTLQSASRWSWPFVIADIKGQKGNRERERRREGRKCRSGHSLQPEYKDESRNNASSARNAKRTIHARPIRARTLLRNYTRPVMWRAHIFVRLKRGRSERNRSDRWVSFAVCVIRSG